MWFVVSSLERAVVAVQGGEEGFLHLQGPSPLPVDSWSLVHATKMLFLLCGSDVCPRGLHKREAKGPCAKSIQDPFGGKTGASGDTNLTSLLEEVSIINSFLQEAF